MRYRPRLIAFAAPALLLGLLGVLAVADQRVAPALRWLFPGESRVVFSQATMLELLTDHVSMVAVSSLLSVLVGVSLGIFATRSEGADFYDVIADLANLGQTFPPIAVFVLAVPILGFGFQPTVLALTLYGVLPVLFNTIAGLRSVPAHVLDSAAGMGMRPPQVLRRVELPLAAPVIIAGVRVSVVVNVSTATLGAIAGAGGFGAPIVSGLANQDPAVTLQGAVLAALLALGLDGLVVAVGTAWAPRVSEIGEG
jgi:osmoprotectant transport system permease protein